MADESSNTGQTALSRQRIIKALSEMSDQLERRGIKGELCLFGGTVMVLAFAARPSTRDVDAIFQPTEIIREIARKIGEASGFLPNWLNDAAKGFVSKRHDTIEGNLPQFPHLRLTMPTPEYMLAMKCMASRIGGIDESHDVSDILFLIRHLKLESAVAVMDIVAAYYPQNQIPVKVQYLVEGLFEEGKI